MPIITATKFSTALELLINTSRDASKLLEVNADGSIREQNWKEKLGNFAARLTRRYDLRKDTKDAAVADALNNLANATVNGHDQVEKNILSIHAKNFHKYGALDRYREAKIRVEARNTPRDIQVRPRADARNRVRSDSLTSIQTGGANNYGATGVSAPPSKIYTAQEKKQAAEYFLTQLRDTVENLYSVDDKYRDVLYALDSRGAEDLNFEEIRDDFSKNSLSFDAPDLAKFASAERDIVAWSLAQKESV